MTRQIEQFRPQLGREREEETEREKRGRGRDREKRGKERERGRRRGGVEETVLSVHACLEA